MVDLREHEVLTVENWNETGVGAPGTWPCGVCHAPHPVERSWYIEVETDTGCVRAVACEDCAEAAERRLVSA